MSLRQPRRYTTWLECSWHLVLFFKRYHQIRERRIRAGIPLAYHNEWIAPHLLGQRERNRCLKLARADESGFQFLAGQCRFVETIEAAARGNLHCCSARTLYD